MAPKDFVRGDKLGFSAAEKATAIQRNWNESRAAKAKANLYKSQEQQQVEPLADAALQFLDEGQVDSCDMCGWQGGRGTEDAVFRLLIPAFYKIEDGRPLRFLDDVLPLHILGSTNQGELVSLNLPDRARFLGGMGLWIGAITVLGPVGVVLDMPLTYGRSFVSMKATKGVHNVIHEKLVRKAVTILGSNETLEPEVDPDEYEI